MEESQSPRMEHLSIIFLGRCLAVHLVTQDGVPDRMQVNPNLMGSSCEDLAKNQGASIRFLDHFEPGVSWTSPLHDSHLLTMDRMAADRLDDFTCRVRESSGAPSQVIFLNLPSGKLDALPQRE